jgi:hypothetical protein
MPTTSLAPKKHRVFFKYTKKVKPLRRVNYGYAAKRKFKRVFNGKEYIRVGQYRIKSITEQIKDRYHKQGYNALIIKSGLNYQLWIHKKD